MNLGDLAESSPLDAENRLETVQDPTQDLYFSLSLSVLEDLHRLATLHAITLASAITKNACPVAAVSVRETFDLVIVLMRSRFFCCFRAMTSCWLGAFFSCTDLRPMDRHFATEDPSHRSSLSKEDEWRTQVLPHRDLCFFCATCAHRCNAVVTVPPSLDYRGT